MNHPEATTTLTLTEHALPERRSGEQSGRDVVTATEGRRELLVAVERSRARPSERDDSELDRDRIGVLQCSR